jgi:hypothetical protein
MTDELNPLSFELDTVEGLDEGVARLYSHDETSNKYYLNVDGAVSKTKLNEFRENNVKLLKEMDALKKQMSEIDVTEYKKLKELAANAGQQGKSFSPDEVESLVKQRVKEMESQWETLNRDLDTRLKTTQAQLENRVIDGDLRDAFAKVGGMYPSALEDILLRARTVFRVEEGRAIPYEADGSILYAKDGRSPMSPQEWLSIQKRNNPHWNIASQGAGSTTSRGGLGATKVDEMTPQQKIAWALENPGK